MNKKSNETYVDRLFCQVVFGTFLRGEKRNYKVVAMEEFQTSYNGFLNFLGYDFWSRSFY